MANGITLEQLVIKLNLETENIRKEVTTVQQQLAKLDNSAKSNSTKMMELNSTLALVTSTYRTLSRVIGSLFTSWNDTYIIQIKLASAMKSGFNATNEQIRSLKEYAKVLRDITYLDDDFILAGASVLASFVDDVNQLKSLLPAMNDLIAKIYGFEANAESAITIAKLIGRALEGSAEALNRYGIVLTEDQKAILADNTISRAEKVKVLVEAISNNAGGLAEMLGNTFEGKLNRIRTAFGDISENIGYALENGLKPMLDVVYDLVVGISKLSLFVKAFSGALFGDNIEDAEDLAGAYGAVGDAVDEVSGKLLSFDKFESLGSAGGSLFGLSSEEIGSITSGLSEAADEISEIRSKIDAFLDIPGMMALVKSALVGVSVVLAVMIVQITTMVALTLKQRLLSLMGGVMGVSKTLSLGNVALVQYSKGLVNIVTNAGAAQVSLVKLALGIAMVYYGLKIFTDELENLITNWQDMSGGERFVAILKVMGSAMVALIGFVMVAKSGIIDLIRLMVVPFIGALNKVMVSVQAMIPQMLTLMATWQGMFIGVSLLAAAIVYFATNLNKMGTAAKILIPIIALLAATFVGLAVARAAAEAGLAAPVMAGVTAAAITAAIVVAAGTALSIGKFADGGIPTKGSLFIANEAGPELVGNIGGQSAVANNTMIVSAIEQAAYRGMSAAAREINTNSQSITIDGRNINDNALIRALMPAIKLELKRTGGKF